MAARRPRSASDHDSDDDSYEVLDLTEYARRHHWWNRLFGRNSGPIVEKYSVATQIVMGGVTGWCAGFLFQKVGKLAATAVGGGFLLLQIASHSGYVQVDWKRVEKDVNKAKKQLKKRANKAAPEINTLIEEALRPSGTLHTIRKPGSAHCGGVKGNAKEEEFVCLNVGVKLGSLYPAYVNVLGQICLTGNHRLTERFGVEEISKIISFQPPAMGRDTFHQTRLLRAPSSLALDTSRDGTSTTSLGSLCQGLTTLTGKNPLNI
ncbi:hypothetical protein HGM15179_000556 [Zosterops borbonicus]|uniref:FUN14 domain-containing protein 1 n=1 Tax=Zosterops borbonicus TaxID=364589 RepID=A0A8K1GZ50_9PASS|nr:hypothetical protein HGM15179_000556 [Zosterops borbonicus]